MRKITRAGVHEADVFVGRQNHCNRNAPQRQGTQP